VKRLNMQGTAHIIVPLLVMVLAGVIGTYFLVASHADISNSSQIQSKASSRCLNVQGNRTTNGSLTEIDDCSAGTQQWQVNSDGTIRSTTSGRCLDVRSYGTTNGSPVQIYDCHATSNQLWTVNSDGTIRSKASGRCLDVRSYGTANGSPVQIYDCHLTSNQLWAISGPASGPVSSPTPVASASCVITGVPVNLAINHSMSPQITVTNTGTVTFQPHIISFVARNGTTAYFPNTTMSTVIPGAKQTAVLGTYTSPASSKSGLGQVSAHSDTNYNVPAFSCEKTLNFST